MRSGIALLLLVTVGIAGCDRQSPAPEQATAATNADSNGSITQPTAAKVDRSHAGEAEPDTPFTAPDGKQVTLADFRGKPVLLNLWATWCPPCVAEMPTLDTLASDLKGKVQVLTVSQDLEGTKVVAPYFKKKQFRTLQPYLDPKIALSTLYAVNLPTTILFNAQGKEVWRVSGGMDWTSAKARKLIDEAG